MTTATDHWTTHGRGQLTDHRAPPALLLRFSITHRHASCPPALRRLATVIWRRIRYDPAAGSVHYSPRYQLAFNIAI